METSPSETKTILLRDCLDKNEVPHLFMDFPTKDGKKQAHKYNGATKGWKKMTYKQTQKTNKNRIGTEAFQLMDINLKNSPFMVVDIDIKEEWKKTWKGNKEIEKEIKKVEEYLGDYYFKTYSVGSGSPHYWFYKHGDDKNTTKTKQKIGKDELKYIEIDLLYQNVFEKRNGAIETGFYYNDIDVEHETKCVFHHFPKIKKKVKLSKKEEKQKVVFKSLINHDMHFPEVDDETRAILDNINPKLFDDFKTWHQFISACFKHFGDYIIAIEYSQKNDKYTNADDVIKHVNKSSNSTFGTICYLSIQSNKEAHYEIRKQYGENWDFTDRGLSKCFLDESGDDFCCQHEDVYVLNKETNRWRVDKKKSILFTTVQEKLIKKYVSAKYKYANLLHELESMEEEDNIDKEISITAERLAKLVDVVTKISTFNDCSNIVKQVKMALNSNSILDIPFDRVRTDYFCFLNRSFSLKTMKEVEIYSKDYITQTTGYGWREPTKEELKTVDDIINMIFVDEDIKNTYLSVLYSGMWGKQFEKFILANGDGRNGKGVLNDLYGAMMGNEYFFNGNINTLTGRDTGNGQGASPDIVNMGMKRFILWAEPEKNATINGGQMKRLTGNTVINARGMYKSEIHPVYMMATCAIECNEKPKINSRTDTSIYERILDVPFESRFLSREQVEKDTTGKVFEENQYFKDTEFKEKHKYALFTYLVRWAKKHWNGKIYVAKRCQEASRKFINSNDELMGWLGNHYNITERRTDHLLFKDIYNDFKTYIEYDRLSAAERKRWRRSAFKEAFDKTEYAVENDSKGQGGTVQYYYIEKCENME